MVSTEVIRSLVEPVLTSAGLELWDVEVGRGIVCIRVDRPDGAVDLDSLASVANGVLSPLLDESPEVVPPGRYQLEVSSPGVERTLRTLQHFRRYIGTEITVKTCVPIAGARRHQGRLVAVDEQGIQLAPAGATDAVLEIRHDQIDRARTVFVWGPAPAPGTQRKASKRASAARSPARVSTAALDPKEAGS
jgi:ribosome maturation factor RimP